MTEQERQRFERLFPLSNELFGAGMGKLWDNRPLGKDWQRIPGCQRVVHASIPSPLRQPAPTWATWVGIVSANGKVYRCDDGREIKPWPPTAKT